jgi:hypothetical protein
VLGEESDLPVDHAAAYKAALIQSKRGLKIPAEARNVQRVSMRLEQLRIEFPGAWYHVR